MRTVPWWHWHEGHIICCSASHVKTFHIKAIQCRQRYFLTSVVNLYVCVSLWGSDGCVFHEVRRVCPGSAPPGFIPLHISCFAHDNTVSFSKTQAVCISLLSWFTTVLLQQSDSIKLEESPLDWSLCHLSIESFWAHRWNKMNSEWPPQGLKWIFNSLDIKWLDFAFWTSGFL